MDVSLLWAHTDIPNLIYFNNKSVLTKKSSTPKTVTQQNAPFLCIPQNFMTGSLTKEGHGTGC